MARLHDLPLEILLNFKFEVAENPRSYFTTRRMRSDYHTLRSLTLVSRFFDQVFTQMLYRNFRNCSEWLRQDDRTELLLRSLNEKPELINHIEKLDLRHPMEPSDLLIANLTRLKCLRVEVPIQHRHKLETATFANLQDLEIIVIGSYARCQAMRLVGWMLKDSPIRRLRITSPTARDHLSPPPMESQSVPHLRSFCSFDYNLQTHLFTNMKSLKTIRWIIPRYPYNGESCYHDQVQRKLDRFSEHLETLVIRSRPHVKVLELKSLDFSAFHALKHLSISVAFLTGNQGCTHYELEERLTSTVGERLPAGLRTLTLSHNIAFPSETGPQYLQKLISGIIDERTRLLNLSSIVLSKLKAGRQCQSCELEYEGRRAAPLDSELVNKLRSACTEVGIFFTNDMELRPFPEEEKLPDLSLGSAAKE